MRTIVEIGEHSLYAPALKAGGVVLDAGANKGLFLRGVAELFPVTVIGIEANPTLAAALRGQGADIVECALGAEQGEVSFNIGDNDEASSLLTPSGEGSLLVIRETLSVQMRPMDAILTERGLSRLACVKLDIEGGEIDVLNQMAPRAAKIAPQWTVEFHDHEQFRLSTPRQVDDVLAAMRRSGFSVLVRDWPHRTNVLFVDRRALGIPALSWWGIKFRYQYFARLWRKLHGM